ncbi:MAG: hypothetical protein VZS44_11405, partial [Bacilli bacterium]|nr:hypothetical protein [Bacilli bacterium]
MSTKIYDAYKLTTSDTSLNSLMVISNEIKQEVEQTAKTQTLPNIAMLIQYIWDAYTFYGEDAYNHINDGENDISEELYNYCIGVIKNKNKLRNSFFYGLTDYKNNLMEWQKYTKLIFIPCDNSVLAMVFGNTTLLGDTFNKYFEDYHYQNQTDKPDYITDEEWEKRKEDWDKAIGSDYIPIRHGLTINLFDIEDIKWELKLLSNINTDTIMKEVENNHKSRVKLIFQTIKKPFDGKTISEYFDWLDTDEYKKWKNEQIERICDKLDIDYSTLN